MSFYLPFTKAEQSTEMFTAPGAGDQFSAEGQAVVRKAGASEQGVMPSTGQASDIFCGFSFAGTSALPFPEPFYTKVEQFLVPATGAVTLSMTPIAGQVFVFDNTTGLPASPTPTVTGNQVSGLTAGDTVTITYKYPLTVVQRRALFGDIQPGGYVGAYVGQIGVITRGTIWTDQYDASADWTKAGTTAALQIVAGPAGQLMLGTPGTNGVAVNGYVVGLPGQDIPFLGITFSAPSVA
jgi:hypothetical protein